MKPAAFMSYAHRDNQYDRLTQLRLHLSAEVSVQIGEDFEIFQDRDGILWGQHWEKRIEESLDEVTFLIAIVTPSFFKSEHCRNELQRFREREKRLGRDDLILPIYYVDTPLANNKARRLADEAAQVIATRQYVDWRELRTEPLVSSQVVKKMAEIGVQVRDALDRVQGTRKVEAQKEPPIKELGEVKGETDRIGSRNLAAEWGSIMGELKRRKQPLTAAVYSEARVEGFDGEVLSLVYPPEQAFHVEMAKDHGHLDKLGKVLEERLGFKPRLEVRAADGNASLDEAANLASQWGQVLRELKQRRQALTAAVYQDARVQRFDGETLILLYSEEHNFHVGMARDAGHLEKLSKVLEELMGKKLRVEVVAAGEAQ